MVHESAPRLANDTPAPTPVQREAAPRLATPRPPLTFDLTDVPTPSPIAPVALAPRAASPEALPELTTAQSADRHAAQPETLALIHLAHEVLVSHAASAAAALVLDVRALVSGVVPHQWTL